MARNILNLRPRRWAVGVLEDGSEQRRSAVRGRPACGPRRAVGRRPAVGLTGATHEPPHNALLLIGSPKPGASSSASLGTYLLESSRARPATEVRRLTKALPSPRRRRGACTRPSPPPTSSSCPFPLYVDSLPAPVIRALELIADDRAGRSAPGVTFRSESDRRGLVAICQCGFPEAQQDEVALEICANFARTAGFEWAGGLAMGGGGLIDARPLAERSGPLRFVVRALEVRRR